METYRKPTTRLFIMLTILGLLVAVMLACGPADETEQRENLQCCRGAQDSDPEATPEPTDHPGGEPTPAPIDEPTPEPCPHTPGEYSALDETLQNVVNKYETCELTAEEAAELAFANRGSKVLVAVHPAEGATLEVDKWMGAQEMNPRAVADFHGPDGLYAYVEVSKLADLAQQRSVSAVKYTVAPFTNPDTHTDPPVPVVGSDGRVTKYTGTDLALPNWLKGYEHPGDMPKLKSTAKTLAKLYLKGTLDMESIRNDSYYKCGIEDDHLGVRIVIKDNSETLARLQETLDGVALREPYTDDDRVHDGLRNVNALIPIPYLPALSLNDDIIEAIGNYCLPTPNG